MKITVKKRALSVLLALVMVLAMLPGVSLAAETKLPFQDVKEGAWYYEAVKYVYENKLMVGTTQTAFAPGESLTRAMVCAILYREEGRPVVKTGGTFKDVTGKEWFADAVNWAAEKSIVVGNGDGTFAPNANVTRQDMAVMLYSYAKYKGYSAETETMLDAFADGGKVSKYAAAAVCWAVGNKILYGFGDDTMRPQAESTRAQFAAVTVRLLTSELIPETDLVILYTNDVHCGIDANIGYAGLAAYRDAMRGEHRDVALVDCGDALQGEAIGTISKGEYLVDIMNYVGYDFMTFGNHEFDYGMDQLKKLVEKADFQFLSCNFMDLRTNEPITKGYQIVNYSGTKVAFVGISTPESITKSTPTYFQDENGEYIYGFCAGNDGKDLYNAVQNAIDSAKAEGADYVVAIGHCGIDEQSSPWMSTEIINNVSGLDVFLDGHSHSTIPCDKITDKDGKEVLLSSTGTKLNAIGKLTIGKDGLTTELVTDYAEKNEKTTEVIEGIKAQYEAMLNEVVAKSEVELTINNAEGKRAIRNAETNLGDLCADAYRKVLGADIAFVNGGGIRVSIPAGDITYGQIIAVHPFGNMACVVEATGQQIIDALEMASRSTPGENGGFLQVSGLKYTIDTSVESTVVTDENKMFVRVDGERRVKDVMVLQADGTYAPIDLEKTYSLASHNYMLKSAGDGINMFQKNKILQDEVMIDNQVLITYIQKNLGGVVGEAYQNLTGEGRITIR